MSDCLHSFSLHEDVQVFCHLPLGHEGLHMDTWTDGNVLVAVTWWAL